MENYQNNYNNGPTPPPVYHTTVYQQSRSNGMAIAGFVCALVALVLFWLPVISWVLWVLGLVFSLIGVFKAPRGFAIAGLIITFIGVIILLISAVGLLALAAAA